MNYEERVFAEIHKEYKNLSKDYNLVYLGLYGSQNYNLHTEQSDVDLKAIVLPSFDDFVANRKPISKTLQTESGGQVDVKDIRLMFDCFKKQNVNFIELLFTQYRLINHEYYKEFRPMLLNNEKIARYNKVASLNCMVGMAYEKRKALCHPYAGIKDKIDKYHFDSKQLHHIFRLKELMDKYMNDVPYSQCLVSDYGEFLKEVKNNNEYFNVEEAKHHADLICNIMSENKERYFTENELFVDTRVEEIMHEVTLNIFKKSFRKEICHE